MVKYEDLTHEEKQNALDEAWQIVKPKTDAERIAEVKELNARFLELENAQEFQKADETLFILRERHMKWLIEQHERANELAKLLEGNDGMSVKEIRAQFTDLHQDFLKEQNKNKRLHEALKFYANNENYQVNVEDEWGPEINVMMDGGNKACLALEDEK